MLEQGNAGTMVADDVFWSMLSMVDVVNNFGIAPGGLTTPALVQVVHTAFVIDVVIFCTRLYCTQIPRDRKAHV